MKIVGIWHIFIVDRNKQNDPNKSSQIEEFRTTGIGNVSLISCVSKIGTVEPVLSGTVFSGHPVLSGQLSKSRKLCPLIIVILTY